MKLISSWDDGGQLDLKIAELLDEYCGDWDKHIFFIPNSTRLNTDEIKQIAEDYTVGGHTVSHPNDLKELSKGEILCEVKDNRQWLQDLTGQDVDWFCYPSGRYDQQVKEIVDKVGFDYARTVDRMNIEGYEDPLEVPTSIHVYPDHQEYEGDWLNAAKRLFEISKEQDGVFHLWGHSWEVEKYQLWDELEEFFQFARQNVGDA